MLRFTMLFLMMITNHNHDITLFNNIKGIQYITESELYTHHYGNEYNVEWFNEV